MQPFYPEKNFKWGDFNVSSDRQILISPSSSQKKEMAVCLDRSKLTPLQEENIRRYLCFQPKVKFVRTNNRFATPPAKEPIFFFRATPTTVTVPYYFGG